MTTVELPAAGSNNEPREQKCTHCGFLLRKGELVCSNCGTMQVPASALASGATKALPNTTETFDSKRARIGNVPREFQRVKFTIANRDLLLPRKSRLVIGRNDPVSATRSSDIDLTPYGAVEMGVSRQHLELTWRNELIFIVDLGSTNRTMLNGQFITPAIERILRDGDLLMIGHLTVNVRFIDT